VVFTGNELEEVVDNEFIIIDLKVETGVVVV
jgi:hypothetical protein